MKKISDLLGKLKKNIRYSELSETFISTGTVGWHIEHSLLVFNAVIDALGKSTPGAYKNKFSISRSFVMISGKIPRGKVKAPSAVQPSYIIDVVALQQHISDSKEKIKTLERLSSDHYFAHPFLGDFKLKPALRFLKIHTEHHLRIIDDIKTKKGRGNKTR